MLVEGIVRGFDDPVCAGKVLCTGFSNLPAWRVGVTELRGVRIKPVAILARLDRPAQPAAARWPSLR